MIREEEATKIFLTVEKMWNDTKNFKSIETDDPTSKLEGVNMCFQGEANRRRPNIFTG